MKLLAQVGFGIGEKVDKGLAEELIDGAIFSPKDIQKSTMRQKIFDLRESYANAELLIDPQFYLSLYADSFGINIGKAGEWSSFRPYRKSDLESTETIDLILNSYFKEMSHMGTTGIIAPGTYISQSFDSREAVIAKNFIRRARRNYSGNGPLYASILICREALLNKREFEEFMNDITLLPEPPDGFYLVIGARSSEARSDIFHADVIANWLMLNLSLATNGFKVINGYSDILTPFLGMAGGYAGALGWWSNLRSFSIDRFFPSISGGRQPIIRYLSKKLLNRITCSEKDALGYFVPEIINNLPHDADYNPERNPKHNSEPERNEEVLQSWEAIKSLNNELTSFSKCQEAVRVASSTYSALRLPLEAKSNDNHLEPLDEGLRLFKERGQI